MSEDIDELDPLESGSGMKPPRVGDYEVGYGKPPRRHQFPKGKSGNPKGRPKETTNLLTSFEDMLDQHDVPAKNGTGVMSKREAIMRTHFDQAGKCNQRRFKEFMRLAKRAGFLKRPALPLETARCARSGFMDMEKFQAEFGKPLPDTYKH